MFYCLAKSGDRAVIWDTDDFSVGEVSIAEVSQYGVEILGLVGNNWSYENTVKLLFAKGFKLGGIRFQIYGEGNKIGYAYKDLFWVVTKFNGSLYVNGRAVMGVSSRSFIVPNIGETSGMCVVNSDTCEIVDISLGTPNRLRK